MCQTLAAGTKEAAAFYSVESETVVLGSFAVGRDKELSDPRKLTWLNMAPFTWPYPLCPPVPPPPLCSCAMAPILKPAKHTTTAAATLVSIDNFIWRITRRLQSNTWSQVALGTLRITAAFEHANKTCPEPSGKTGGAPGPIFEPA